MNSLNPSDFLRTVYVGDRACESILIDGWNEKVALQVDLLSRIRSPDGKWAYYSAEDIPHGRIVFTGVEAIELDPSGPLPNDYINDISVKRADPSAETGRWIFEASISSVARGGSSTEIIVRITGRGVHLEDPTRAGVEIRD